MDRPLVHYSAIKWDFKRWPNFHPKEFASPDNGMVRYWPEFYDRLQFARTQIGKPFKINSAYRSWRYNLKVGGAPRSEHKRLALDVSLRGHNRHELHRALRLAGFKGFGFYQTFIHVDLGRKRFWYGGEFSKKAWSNGSS